MLWDVWVIDLKLEQFYLSVSGVSQSQAHSTVANWSDVSSVLVAIPSGCLIVSNPLLCDCFFNQGLKRVG